jgi:hypothetical protein
MSESIRPEVPDLSGTSLAEIARLAAEKKLPPVERWNPERCGDSDMQILSDGTWLYRGTPIGRQALVELFSTVLRREPDGSYVLVTPAEKLDIAVDDAPFVAVEVTSEGEGEARTLAFRTNVGDIVIAGPDHPLRLEMVGDEPRPYIHVRGTPGNGLEALVNRAVFYELAEMALEADPPGLWSGGSYFAFG